MQSLLLGYFKALFFCSKRSFKHIFISIPPTSPHGETEVAFLEMNQSKEIMLNTKNWGRYAMVAALGAAVVGLQGCGSKLDCNGGKNKDQVIAIIQSHLNNAVWYQEVQSDLTGGPELENIKTVSHGDSQSQCTGSYTFALKGKSKSIDVAYYLDYLEDKGETEVKVDVNSVKTRFIQIIVSDRMGH